MIWFRQALGIGTRESCPVQGSGMRPHKNEGIMIPFTEWQWVGGEKNVGFSPKPGGGRGPQESVDTRDLFILDDDRSMMMYAKVWNLTWGVCALTQLCLGAMVSKVFHVRFF